MAKDKELAIVLKLKDAQYKAGLKAAQDGLKSLKDGMEMIKGGGMLLGVTEVARLGTGIAKGISDSFRDNLKLTDAIVEQLKNVPIVGEIAKFGEAIADAILQGMNSKMMKDIDFQLFLMEQQKLGEGRDKTNIETLLNIKRDLDGDLLDEDGKKALIVENRYDKIIKKLKELRDSPVGVEALGGPLALDELIRRATDQKTIAMGAAAQKAKDAALDKAAGADADRLSDQIAWEMEQLQKQQDERLKLEEETANKTADLWSDQIAWEMEAMGKAQAGQFEKSWAPASDKRAGMESRRGGFSDTFGTSLTDPQVKANEEAKRAAAKAEQQREETNRLLREPRYSVIGRR